MLCSRDLLPLQEYQRHRPALRAAAIALRRRRSLALGPCMRLTFENGATLRHQIHEMLHAARADDPAARAEELAACAPLLPRENEWRATLQIELPDAAERAGRLPRLSAAAHRLHLELPGHAPVPARANEDLDDGHLGRPSAVHFLRFELPGPVQAALRDGAACELACIDEAYAWRVPVSPALQAALLDDRPAAPAA